MGMGDTAASSAATTTEIRSLAEIAADAVRSWCPDCGTRQRGAYCAEGQLHARLFQQALLDGNITEAEFRRAVGGGGLHLRLIPVP